MTITIWSHVPAVAVLIAAFSSPAFAGQQPATQNAAAAADIPSMAKEYVADQQNSVVRGHRVEFSQQGERLSASWSHAAAGPYGRSSFEWDPKSQSFRGTTITKFQCPGLDVMAPPRMIDVVVREEIQLVNERVMRDSWTKPLKVDCTTGSMQIFEWDVSLWSTPESNSVKSETVTRRQ